MAPLHVGHCQVPVMQKQTTTEAWIKHKRVLEDSLKKSRMDVTQHVALSFDKSGSHANDRRSVLHQCLFVTALDHEQNAWSSCAAATKGVIGPCPLMRVSDMVGFDPDNRFGAASRTEQKGIPAHSEIISSYLRGIECQDGDIVIFVDCLPNRYCEFGQAILARHLDESNRRPPLYYLGFLREEQRDTATMIEDKVYKYWDSSDMAPGKQRPSESIAEPTLELLSWVNSAPRFPDSLLTKFGEGTGPHSEIHAMKKELLQEFPQAGGGDNRPTSTRPQTVRASGRPDYSIDGGGRPLDTSRVIQAAHTAASAFGVERKWYCPAARGKPAVVIDSNFAIHLGNETDQEMSLTAMEICGFNTGTFEQKIIAGLGEAELDGVCFRFSSDLCLVSYERKLYAIADFLHHCMTVHGVAEIDFSNHQLIQKTYPLEEDSAEAVPVPYRYGMSPARNGMCNVFKPNMLSSNDTVRHAMIGAGFCGHMDKLPRGAESALQVVWEVDLQTGSGSPRVVGPQAEDLFDGFSHSPSQHVDQDVTFS
ncbi:unnamed protein product [Durusdinium trenchii]|uniref:Uncharacterized protein n=1 Tax=Durusdinium trenchii TaxID=1381693 RepID=A0ABP0PIJ8_9DINO